MKKFLKGNLMIFTLEMISFGKINIFRTLITTVKPVVKRFSHYEWEKRAKERHLWQLYEKMRVF